MIPLALERVVPALRAAGLSSDAVAAGVAAQETTYLLQRAGAKLGYHFVWEVVGPFSTELAETLNEASPMLVEELGGSEAEGEVEEAASLVRTLRERRPDGALPEQRWLRLLACVDFLKEIGVTLDNGSIPPFVRNTFASDLIEEADHLVDEVLLHRNGVAA